MPPPSARVTVVRPYGTRIRTRVFALVQAAGYRIEADDVIDEGLSDDEAVRRIVARDVRRLVVPYHGHRDHAGASRDGLRFLAELHARVPAFPYRVLMPVSRFGAAAVAVARARIPAALADAILFAAEDELGEALLVARLAEHFRDERTR